MADEVKKTASSAQAAREEVIRQKMAAGLTREQAETVLAHQADFDAAEEAKKKKK